MKCGALVKYEIRGKKHPKKKITWLISQALEAMGFVLPEPRENYEICDGDVKATVEIDDDSQCCCCSNAYLTLTYTCNKCGNTNFPELPDVSEINNLITYSLDDLDHQALIKKYQIIQTELKAKGEKFNNRKKLKKK
jgi:hypothetical protein